MYFDWPIPAYIRFIRKITSLQQHTVYMQYYNGLLRKDLFKPKKLGGNVFQTKFWHAEYHTMFSFLFFTPSCCVWLLPLSPTLSLGISMFTQKHQVALGAVFCWYLILAVYKLFRISSIIKRTVIQKVGKCHFWFSKEIV